jgi:phage repressor protein C with HTH and peptisase S24 domain
MHNAGMAVQDKHDDRPEAARRLEAARLARGFATAKQAAEFFGWNYVTYSQHESGERGITRAAGRYAEAYRVGEGWLLTGEGKGPQGEVVEAPRERSRGQRVTRESIIAGRDLVDYGGKLNVYSGAQGGAGKLIVGTDIIDRVAMPAVLREVPGAYGILIDGESMVPEFWPGDVAWVNPHLRPQRGRNVILYHTPPFGDDAEAMIKRLNGWNDREWDLEQWNPHRKFKEYRKEWPLCHRVVGKYDAS